MSGTGGDLVLCKAGWVKIKEVLSPKAKSSGAQIKFKMWKDVWMILRKCGECFLDINRKFIQLKRCLFVQLLIINEFK